MNLSESCWIWARSRFPNGYGQAWMHTPRRGEGGKYGRPIQAHRLVYEMFNGAIPDSKQLDHLCRQRGCVNPAHLRVVSCKENIHANGSKCEAAKNATKTHCIRGHALAGENLYQYGTKRYCKECKRNEKRARRAALQAR